MSVTLSADLVINFSKCDPARFEALMADLEEHFAGPNPGPYHFDMTFYPPITATHPRTGRRVTYGAAPQPSPPRKRPRAATAAPRRR